MEEHPTKDLEQKGARTTETRRCFILWCAVKDGNPFLAVCQDVIFKFFNAGRCRRLLQTNETWMNKRRPNQFK